MKLVAQNGSCPPRVVNLVNSFRRSQSLEVQQRCIEFQALLRHADVMVDVLPVDASCEDVDVDELLSTLDGFCLSALQAGAKPYSPPSHLLDDDDGTSKRSSLKVTPYELPALPVVASNALSMLPGPLGAGSAGPGSIIAPPTVPGPTALGPAISNQQANLSIATAQGNQLIGTRGVQQVWGKKVEPPPPPPVPAPSAAVPSSSATGAGTGAGAGPSSTSVASSAAPAAGSALPAAASPAAAAPPIENKPKVLTEKEKMAAALFGGMGGGGAAAAKKKPLTQTAHPNPSLNAPQGLLASAPNHSGSAWGGGSSTAGLTPNPNLNPSPVGNSIESSLGLASSTAPAVTAAQAAVHDNPLFAELERGLGSTPSVPSSSFAPPVPAPPAPASNSANLLDILDFPAPSASSQQPSLTPAPPPPPVPSYSLGFAPPVPSSPSSLGTSINSGSVSGMSNGVHQHSNGSPNLPLPATSSSSFQSQSQSKNISDAFSDILLASPSSSSSSTFSSTSEDSQLMRPLQIATAEFGRRWGSNPAEAKKSSPTSVLSLEQLRSAFPPRYQHVESIASTQEAIFAATHTSLGCAVLVHVKLVASRRAVDVTVKSSGSELCQREATAICNALSSKSFH